MTLQKGIAFSIRAMETAFNTSSALTRDQCLWEAETSVWGANDAIVWEHPSHCARLLALELLSQACNGLVLTVGRGRSAAMRLTEQERATVVSWLNATSCIGIQTVGGHVYLEIGQREGDDAVEAARPGEGSIKGGRSIGGRNDHHAGIVLEPIHLCQQLVDGVHRLCSSSSLSLDAVTQPDKELYNLSICCEKLLSKRLF